MPQASTCTDCGSVLAPDGSCARCRGTTHDDSSTRSADPAPAHASTIGPYRLLKLLGEGGMGSVWMAEQVEPIRRTVAIKLIRSDLDSERVMARFEAERQALALMNHPNIARVLDAGTTPEGRPYFVMELVHGMSRTDSAW